MIQTIFTEDKAYLIFGLEIKTQYNNIANYTRWIIPSITFKAMCVVKRIKHLWPKRQIILFSYLFLAGDGKTADE